MVHLVQMGGGEPVPTVHAMQSRRCVRLIQRVLMEGGEHAPMIHTVRVAGEKQSICDSCRMKVGGEYVQMVHIA